MNDRQMLSTIERSLWIRRMIVAFVVDAALCTALIHWTAGEYAQVEWWQGFVGVAVLWIIQMILGLKNWLTALATFKAFEKPLYVDLFLQVLRVNKLEPPYMAQPKRFAYLAELADDIDADTEDRVKAAHIYGTWSGIMQAKGTYAELEISRSFDEAVRRYANEAPPSKRGY